VLKEGNTLLIIGVNRILWHISNRNQDLYENKTVGVFMHSNSVCQGKQLKNVTENSKAQTS
jgi:hypothetical protein